MPWCGLFVGSLALSLGEVASVRQQLESSSAGNVVRAISALLQQRNMGNDALLHQISDYASVAVTPGAADSLGTSLKVVANDIETHIEKKIKAGQSATQGKLDTLFKGLQEANTAADTAKTVAVSSDKTWFDCSADEQAKRQAAEVAEKGLTASRNNENEACQLQQDSKGFAFDATGKYKLDFDCDHGLAGNCAASLKKYQTLLQNMFTDAEAALAKEATAYNSLKSSCDAKKQERVQAQSSLDSADSAWSTKRAECAKLAPQRESSMCAFGTRAQAKCSAEAEFTKIVAATQQAKGDGDSEADREREWLASRSIKCVITKAMQKGLDDNLAGADLDACAAQVNFTQDVGKLNTHQAEFTQLSRTNACVNGVISFFNGQTWNVPAGAKPSSKSYTRTKFAPQFDPSTSNFDFCSAPAPAPVAPVLKYSKHYCGNRGGCGAGTCGGSPKFSRNVGKNKLAACAAFVTSQPLCGNWFDYGMGDGWCDCVTKEIGECQQKPYGSSGYSVYKLE